MIDRIRFAQTLKEYNIELTEKQMDHLDKYAEILVEYNEKVNLTAITDPFEIVYKHFKRFITYGYFHFWLRGLF